MAKIDWRNDYRRQLARASREVPIGYAMRDPGKSTFAATYAGYVKQQNVAGRKPLPPLLWIEYLRAKSRKGEAAT